MHISHVLLKKYLRCTCCSVSYTLYILRIKLVALPDFVVHNFPFILSGTLTLRTNLQKTDSINFFMQASVITPKTYPKKQFMVK